MVKVNIDAGFKLDSKKAAVGIIGMDDEGRSIGGMGKEVAATSPFMAKCMAALTALECAGQLSNERMILKTDCQELYRWLKMLTSKVCEWESVDVLQQCIHRWRQMKGWSLAPVSRKGNEAVDHLAACALREMVRQGWFYEPPSSLEVLIGKDMTGRRNEQEEKSGIG